MSEISTGAPRRPVLRYHGGKFRLAPWILEHLPEHRVYVEPYGGAASVLMQKARSHGEVYNDLDGEVVNVFRVFQDPEAKTLLKERLHVTPYAREEFELAHQSSADPIERARRTLIRSFMGFSSASQNADHSTGFRSYSGSVTSSRAAPAREWASYPSVLDDFSERLAGVVIEHRQALDVVRQHDSPATLHYADPPYPHATRRFKKRRTGQSYRHELTDDDHRELSAVLHSVAGLVVLSGYACPLYDDELYSAWPRVERKTHADGAIDRTEVLWLSPRTWERLQAERALDEHPTLFGMAEGQSR